MKMVMKWKENKKGYGNYEDQQERNLYDSSLISGCHKWRPSFMN